MSAFTEEVVISNTPLPIEGGNSNAIKVDGSAVTQPVSGTVTVSNPGLTDTQLRASPVPVTQGGSAIATTTQITSTGSNQTLLVANPSRKRVVLFFNSGIWDVKLGATASTTSRLLRVSSSNYYLEIDYYTGQIDASCTTAGKLVDVTEIA